jgi:hypothetical protein
MRAVAAWLAILVFFSPFAYGVQVAAGGPEDQALQRILAETNAEAKLRALLEFEKQFPGSKVLTDIYLMFVEVYRQKDDRPKIIEYGEKTLKGDSGNVTAMIILSRNYALEGRDLDRAIALGEQAVERVAKMKSETAPSRYTDEQWQAHVRESESSARGVLEYARSVKTYRTQTQGK